MLYLLVHLLDIVSEVEGDFAEEVPLLDVGLVPVDDIVPVEGNANHLVVHHVSPRAVSRHNGETAVTVEAAGVAVAGVDINEELPPFGLDNFIVNATVFLDSLLEIDSFHILSFSYCKDKQKKRHIQIYFSFLFIWKCHRKCYIMLSIRSPQRARSQGRSSRIASAASGLYSII